MNIEYFLRDDVMVMVMVMDMKCVCGMIGFYGEVWRDKMIGDKNHGNACICVEEIWM